MFKTLRIICPIISALCAAAVLPIGAFFDIPWALLCAGAAFLFYLAMLFFKQQQEKKETEAKPTTSTEPTSTPENENSSKEYLHLLLTK